MKTNVWTSVWQILTPVFRNYPSVKGIAALILTYLKIAIVLLGATLGVKSAEQLGLAKAIVFRGLCAIVEAYRYFHRRLVVHPRPHLVLED